ncbi:MAG: transcription antitermination factor NusB [Chlorobiota bacterium]|nr:transcription antitermination factor NusB [Chlorobiota bacterium]QQS65884.1 MAG: transcription antitermination factor NusB [Chlorobiota bacterium]
MQIDNSKLINRRTVRERVMQSLYAQIVSEDKIDIIAERILYPDFKNKPDLMEFAVKLIRVAFNNRAEFDKIIVETTSNWELNRIAIVDKALIYIGLAEFTHFPEIPPKVTINEAIEISKIYSTEKSGVFINGILDGALDYIKINGGINKTGRGLIDESLL